MRTSIPSTDGSSFIDRIVAQYQRDFGKGRARFGGFSSFDGLFVRNAGYVACARVYANSHGAESTGTRKAGKKGPKKAKLQVALTRPELRRLRRWILENSMRTGERNLAAPEIVDHIKEAYGVDVSVFCVFDFFLCLCIVDELLSREQAATAAADQVQESWNRRVSRQGSFALNP